MATATRSRTSTPRTKSRRPAKTTNRKTAADGSAYGFTRAQIVMLTVGHICRYGGDARVLEDHARELAKLLKAERTGK